MTTLAWLPDKKYYEYIFHKHYNPGVEWQNWNPWDQWNYPDGDLVRWEQVIARQISYIKNQRVLDVGCFLGHMSLFCLHNGAKHVTGTDVRDESLVLAQELTQIAGYSNCDFKNTNVNDPQFQELCSNHDTVLLAGVLPILTNHFEVLRTIANSRAQTLIIDSPIVSNSLTPTIDWRIESTQVKYSGYDSNNTAMFVGTPNHRWLEQALVHLGFNLVYNNIFEFVNDPEGTLNKHCVIVGKKLI